MDVMMMVTADYASVSQSGKFTLVDAGFTEINAKQVPYTHPMMFLFVRLKITRKDVGKNKVVIRLVGEKGLVSKPIEINLDVKMNENSGGEQFINIPWQLINTKFETVGDYNFEIQINGDIPRLWQTLKVKLIQTKQAS